MNWAIYTPSDILSELSADKELLDIVPAVQVESDAFVGETQFHLENIAYSGTPVIAVTSLFPDSVCRNLHNAEPSFLESLKKHVQEQTALYKTFGCQFISVDPNTAKNGSDFNSGSEDICFWSPLSEQLSESQIGLCLNYYYPLTPNMCYKSYTDMESSSICGQLDVYLNNLQEKLSINEILSECNFNIGIIRINYLRVEGMSPSNEFLMELRDWLANSEFETLVIFRPLYENYSVLRQEWLHIDSLLSSM